jgi:hypothetical protein
LSVVECAGGTAIKISPTPAIAIHSSVGAGSTVGVRTRILRGSGGCLRPTNAIAFGVFELTVVAQSGAIIFIAAGKLRLAPLFILLHPRIDICGVEDTVLVLGTKIRAGVVTAIHPGFAAAPLFGGIPPIARIGFTAVVIVFAKDFGLAPPVFLTGIEIHLAHTKRSVQGFTAAVVVFTFHLGNALSLIAAASIGADVVSTAVVIGKARDLLGAAKHGPTAHDPEHQKKRAELKKTAAIHVQILQLADAQAAKPTPVKATTVEMAMAESQA